MLSALGTRPKPKVMGDSGIVQWTHSEQRSSVEWAHAFHRRAMAGAARSGQVQRKGGALCARVRRTSLQRGRRTSRPMHVVKIADDHGTEATVMRAYGGDGGISDGGSNYYVCYAIDSGAGPVSFHIGDVGKKTSSCKPTGEVVTKDYWSLLQAMMTNGSFAAAIERHHLDRMDAVRYQSEFNPGQEKEARLEV